MKLLGKAVLKRADDAKKKEEDLAMLKKVSETANLTQKTNFVLLGIDLWL